MGQQARPLWSVEELRKGYWVAGALSQQEEQRFDQEMPPNLPRLG